MEWHHPSCFALFVVIMHPMQSDPSSLPTPADARPEAAVHKPTPIGLIGLTMVDSDRHADLPLTTTPPRAWRYAKYAMAVVLPVGVALAAHRISEPEGLDAAEAPEASALEFVKSADSLATIAPALSRPPARAFAAAAFGHSNAVRVRVVLPNERLRLPLSFDGATVGLQAQWIAFDGKANDVPMAWPSNGVVRAPARAGAFWLVLSRGGIADTLADLALFVEHPMPNVRATGINGYHMGRWPKASDGAVPRGFIEVTERISDFPLSPHLKLSDFVVHDAQDAYPKYLHVREPLLDKIELTVAEVAAMRGRAPTVVKLNVASGFRSPAHNGVLSGSAQDSRHMYGDAADIAIDANNDGRLTEIDARLVASAAEAVERKHPDLVGGIGLYITPDGAGWPYVHIDVRGHRARWRGGAKRGAAVDSLPPDASFDSAAAAVRASASAAAAPVVTPAVVTERIVEARPAVAPRKMATKARPRLRAQSEASYSRSTPRRPTTTTRPAPAPASDRTTDDPFANAARKFRASRP